MWISVEVVSGVRIVQCHAIIDVVIDVRVMLCHAIIDVVIGVRVMLCHQAIDNSGFSTFLNFSTSCPNSHLVVRLYQFIITFPCSHLVHTFAPRNSEIRLSNSEKVRDFASKVPAWTLVIPRPRRRRKNGTEHTPSNLKENGTPKLKKWWNTSKKLDTQYSEVSVR